LGNLARGLKRFAKAWPINENSSDQTSNLDTTDSPFGFPGKRIRDIDQFRETVFMLGPTERDRKTDGEKSARNKMGRKPLKSHETVKS
jgi:hypothetical protein